MKNVSSIKEEAINKAILIIKKISQREAVRGDPAL
jgi:hypothetical protein